MLVFPVESVAQLDAGDVMVEVIESNVMSAPVPFCPQMQPHHGRIAHLAHLVATELQPVNLPVRHHFSKGVYGRELFHFAGVTLVGKIHKHQNMLVMLQGTATLFDEAGGRRLVQAPEVWVTPPGVQRAAYAHTDCIWLSVHGTNETDLEKIEAEFIAQDALDYERFLLLQQNKGA